MAHDRHDRIGHSEVTVRRTADGVIDYGYYSAGARQLRAEVIHQGLRRAGRALRRFIDQRIVQPLRHRRKYRATYGALMELDDRMLKDIGMSRSDIPAVAKGVWIPFQHVYNAAGLRTLHAVVEKSPYRPSEVLQTPKLRDAA